MIVRMPMWRAWAKMPCPFTLPCAMKVFSFLTESYLCAFAGMCEHGCDSAKKREAAALSFFVSKIAL